MITIRDIEIDDYPSRCGTCNTNAVAVVEATNVKILLCDECLKEFIDSGNQLMNSLKARCRNCVHFEAPYAPDYAGRCLLPDNIRDRDWLDTCNKFEAKNEH